MLPAGAHHQTLGRSPHYVNKETETQREATGPESEPTCSEQSYHRSCWAQGPPSRLQEARDSHTHASKRGPTRDDSPSLHRPRRGAKWFSQGAEQTLNLFAPVSKRSRSHSWRMKQRPARTARPAPDNQHLSIYYPLGPSLHSCPPSLQPQQKGPIMTSQAGNYVISLGRRLDPGTKGSLLCKWTTRIGGQLLQPSSF